MLSVDLADFIDGHDVGMFQPCGRFSFDIKALNVFLASQIPTQNHLNRDGAVQTDLPSTIDDAHATAGDLSFNFVVPKNLAATAG